jgi:ferrous iron transport protein A
MATLANAPLNTDFVIGDLIGDAVFVARLREIGFIRGETVRVSGRAPFGDPLLIEIRGAMIALRIKEAGCVQVK